MPSHPAAAGGPVVGVGIDLVDIARMRRALRRTPRLEDRVFTPRERADARARPSPDASFAARFAAKEAARKAVGRAVRWQDIEVESAPDGRPAMSVAGRPDLRFEVSMTHTRELAAAMVVAQNVS